MRFDFVAKPAEFLERPNRFRISRAYWRVARWSTRTARIPGRLRELLLPSVRVYVSPARSAANRRTAYDLRFVEHPETGQLVSLDTRLPNAIFAEGLASGFFAPFAGHRSVRSEVTLAGGEAGAVRSRIDFVIEDRDGRLCWVEVKSVTLVEAGRAAFPDAPTTRG
ncbi:MAG: DNA/RNA nuclease SfsA, partial [Caldilineaceae bacterium]|nr:DNA/RNA nuclease SfsA [Caldilineaceae bacterium]